MIQFSPEDYCIRNEDTINALEKDVGGEVVTMLLGVFINETQALYEQIPDSLNAQNALEVTRLLHSIKSGSKTYGADRLAQFSALLENAARQEQLSDVETSMENLQSILNDTLRHFT